MLCQNHLRERVAFTNTVRWRIRRPPAHAGGSDTYLRNLRNLWISFHGRPLSFRCSSINADSEFATIVCPALLG
jgi:hypothetical protein